MYSRVYGEVRAVDRVSLTVQAGEFFAMLGPSGSGKTTCLRLIAGFETPDSGQRAAGWPRRHRRSAVRARRQHGLSGLRAVSAHERAGERRATGRACAASAGDERQRRALEMLELVQLGHFARSPSCAALRRAAAACFAGARAHQSAARAAARRAARRARSEAARGNADRAEESAAPARHHVRVRHARPGRGAVDGGSRRGVQSRPDRATRHAACALHAPGHRVRRALRRQRERGHGRVGAAAQRSRRTVRGACREHSRCARRLRRPTATR